MFPDLYKEVIAAHAAAAAGGGGRARPVPLRRSSWRPWSTTSTCCASSRWCCKYAQAVEIEKLAREKGLFVASSTTSGSTAARSIARRQLRARAASASSSGRGQADRALLLPPLELPELVHQRQHRPVHLHRLPLRGPGLLHHRPEAGRGLGPRRRRASSPTATRATSGPTAGCVWENGAILSVTNGLGYPDEGAGSNDQGLCMFCEGDGKTGHDPPRRPVPRRRPTATSRASAAAARSFNYVSPDFFRLVPWEGDGLQAGRLRLRFRRRDARHHPPHRERGGRPAPKPRRWRSGARSSRRSTRKGIIATPANSSINELVVEAARLSILNDGDGRRRHRLRRRIRTSNCAGHDRDSVHRRNHMATYDLTPVDVPHGQDQIPHHQDQAAGAGVAADLRGAAGSPSRAR